MLASSIALLVALALGTPALAAPTARCDVSGLTVPLPAQNTIQVPAGQKIEIVTMGRGVQNYTCTDGLWVSKGALANLYDVGCFAVKTSSTDELLALSEKTLAQVPFPQTTALPFINGKHEFVTIGEKAFPAFFDAGLPSNRVTGNLTGKIDAPVNPAKNVAWLQLTAIPGQGDFSKTVFRIGTAGGQPAKPTCEVEGRNLSVPYAAYYYFLQ